MTSISAAAATTTAQACVGRPRVGDYRLQCILPRYVLDELVRVENETELEPMMISC